MIDRQQQSNGGGETGRGPARRGGIRCRGQKLSPKAKLPLSQALLVKSAEFWLRLGEPNAALGELQKLPNGAQQHPWALAVSLAGAHAVSEANEVTDQACSGTVGPIGHPDTVVE